MGDNSAIAWTDHTWNPWRGCRKITSGCANCYMFRDQERYGSDPRVIQRTKTWHKPGRWQVDAEDRGTTFRVFTCSWSDFFIEEADPWRSQAWAVVHACDRLHFQILTKRPERILGNLPEGWDPVLESGIGHGPYPNAWLGVSVENRKQGLPRIDILREIPAALRFLSIEPLLEDLGEIDLRGIGWVIVGGESGPGFRPMDHAWAESIREQCAAAGVPLFFKQSSGLRPETGIELSGRIVREFPEVAVPQPDGQGSLFTP